MVDLHIVIVEGNKLKKTELFTKQDPYEYLEYGYQKFRTKTCKDGHTSPKFGDKVTFSLVEGLHTIQFYVWNSNTFTDDAFIGSGTIELQNVLSSGYDDNIWKIYENNGRYAGEVNVIMHCERQEVAAAEPSTPTRHYYTAPGSPHYDSRFPHHAPHANTSSTPQDRPYGQAHSRRTRRAPQPNDYDNHGGYYPPSPRF